MDNDKETSSSSEGRSDIFKKLVPEYEPLIKRFQSPDATPFRDRPLDRIHSFPKNLRGEQLKEFKGKWINEHTKLASLQSDLIDQILQAPDMTFDELMQELDNRQDMLNLTTEQYRIGRDLIDAYVVRHDQLVKIADRYRNPEGSPFKYDGKRMFEDFFGVKPKGPVMVGVAPVAFHFECANSSDFARIFYYDLFSARGHKSNETLKQEEESVEDVYGVFKEDPILVDRRLKGVVSATHSAIVTSKAEDSIKIGIHEGDHSIQNFFKRTLREVLERKYHNEGRTIPASLRDFTEYDAVDLGDVIDTCTTEEEKLALLRQFLVSERKYGERLAKDEILAYLFERKSPQTVKNYLLRRAENEEAYDFFDEDWVESTVANYADILGGEYEMQIRFLIAQVVKEAYEEVVSTSIEAFEELTRNGFTVDQALNQLRMVPLRQWPKRVQRILEQR